MEKILDDMKPQEKHKELIEKMRNVGKVKYLLEDYEIEGFVSVLAEEMAAELNLWYRGTKAESERIKYWQEVGRCGK